MVSKQFLYLPYKINNEQKIFKKCKHCEDVIDIDSLYVHASSSNNDNNYDDSKIEKIENNWHPTCIFII